MTKTSSSLSIRGFIQHHLCGFRNFRKHFCLDMSGAGFTLIELLVVIAIIGVLTIFTIAGYDNYRKAQILQTASNEVATMLNLARSRAQSQIKPPVTCPNPSPSNTLNGYKVVITAPKSYALQVSCSASGDKPIVGQSKQLPKDVAFTSVPNPSFFFPIQTGGVTFVNGNTIVVQYGGSGGETKTITVDPALGEVSIQ